MVLDFQRELLLGDGIILICYPEMRHLIMKQPKVVLRYLLKAENYTKNTK